mmetsp:Transcript_1666/g.6489  ORF Transcript_1666/g.6489 Transcript_1666/m.6489 type:complete len:527 (+) Transcript_1666:1686-3266(+)
MHRIVSPIERVVVGDGPDRRLLLVGVGRKGREPRVVDGRLVFDSFRNRPEIVRRQEVHVRQTRLGEVFQVPDRRGSLARERRVLAPQVRRRGLVQGGKVPDVKLVDGHVRGLERVARARRFRLAKRVPPRRFELRRVHVAHVRALAVRAERPRVRVGDDARDDRTEAPVRRAPAPRVIRLDLVPIVPADPLGAEGRAPHAVALTLPHIHPISIVSVAPSRPAVQQERHAPRVGRPQRHADFFGAAASCAVDDASEFALVPAEDVVERAVRLHRRGVPEPPVRVVRRHRQLALQHPRHVTGHVTGDSHHRVPGVPHVRVLIPRSLRRRGVAPPGGSHVLQRHVPRLRVLVHGPHAVVADVQARVRRGDEFHPDAVVGCDGEWHRDEIRRDPMRPRLGQVHVARGQGRDLRFVREHARVPRHHVHGAARAEGVDVQGLDASVGLVSPVHDEGELSRVRGEDHLVRGPIPPFPRGDRARQRGVPVRLVRDVLPDVQAERRGLAVASVVVDQHPLTRDGRRGGCVRGGVT